MRDDFFHEKFEVPSLFAVCGKQQIFIIISGPCSSSCKPLCSFPFVCGTLCHPS
ncbi:unnamed protein product, partial [Musa banksii]